MVCGMALAASCSVARVSSFSSDLFAKKRKSPSPSSGENNSPLSPTKIQPLPETLSSRPTTLEPSSVGGLFPPSNHQSVTGGCSPRAGNSNRIFELLGYISFVRPEHSASISVGYSSLSARNGQFTV